MLTDSQHSVLPPSSAARRMMCAGSRALESQYRQTEDTPQSREGQAAHWVALQYAKYNGVGVGTVAPNGEPITQEMLEGATLYAKSILDVAGLPKVDNPIFFETPIAIDCLYEGCWGTPDAWWYSFSDSCLYIWDYKFGFSQVDAFENWQLIAYAAGILSNEKYERGTLITFRIVQPRPYNRIDEWTVTHVELLQYIATLRASEHAAMAPDARCTPNPLGCKDCSARHACEALQRAGLSAIDLSTSNLPVDLTPAQLGGELTYLQRASKLLDARRTGLEAQALAEIKNGKRVPGFTLEASDRRECWNKPTEEILALGSIYGVNLAKPATPVTPKQAEAAGVPKEILGNYSHRPAGEMKLIAENLKSTRKIFGGQ